MSRVLVQFASVVPASDYRGLVRGRNASEGVSCVARGGLCVRDVLCARPAQVERKRNSVCA